MGGGKSVCRWRRMDLVGLGWGASSFELQLGSDGLVAGQTTRFKQSRLGFSPSPTATPRRLDRSCMISFSPGTWYFPPLPAKPATSRRLDLTLRRRRTVCYGCVRAGENGISNRGRLRCTFLPLSAPPSVRGPPVVRCRSVFALQLVRCVDSPPVGGQLPAWGRSYRKL